MEQINVFIVDDSSDTLNHLSALVNSQANMKVIGTAVNGEDAIEQLSNNIDIDILLLDIIMPFASGERVLKKIYDDNLIPKCRGKICYSGLVSQTILNSVQKFGGDMFLLKPYGDQMLIDNINELSMKNHPDLQDINIEKRVAYLLHQLGMPAHLQGYSYLKTAIQLCFYDFKKFTAQITKELYPEVAKMHSTTSARVERSMRNAIDVAWTRGEISSVEKIFGFSVDLSRGKPTNSEFISLLADYLIIREKEKRNKITQ